jgi:hypothetical protein
MFLTHCTISLQPLELDVLKKEVKDSGIKCSMDKLMDFLDERVKLPISFAMEMFIT